VPIWFDERPYLGSAAQANGRDLAGEVEHGVLLVALEDVQGSEAFARFRGWTFGLHDLVSVDADGGGQPWWPEPVMGMTLVDAAAWCSPWSERLSSEERPLNDPGMT
jgi:hypothetical protein